MLKLTLKILAFISFALAVTWIYFEPNKYEPWVAAIAALVLFLSLFLPDALRHRKGQNQHVTNGSSAIQAGGDVTINANGDRH